MPQGPREGTFALSECKTFGRRVKMRPTSRCGAARVRYDEPGSSWRSFSVLRVRPCDDPQQLTLGGSLPATDARAYGTVGVRRDVEFWNHRPTLYRGGAANPNSVSDATSNCAGRATDHRGPRIVTPRAAEGRSAPRQTGCRSATR